MTKIVLALVPIVYLLLLVGSVSAQNMTNQTITSMNMTNVTGSATGSALAKVKILEAIKSLEIGDKSSALVELTAAEQAIAGESDQAKMHFNEGMKAFSAGDTNGTLKHLKAADEALG